MSNVSDDYSRYKYHVSYSKRKRSESVDYWYAVTWPKISDWCNATYGIGGWEYLFDEFAFLTEEDRLLFTMKWQ